MPIKDVSRATLFRPGFSGPHQTPNITTFVEGSPDTPVRRRVCLFQQDTKRLAAEGWSDPVTGIKAFDHLAPGVYFAVSFDHTGVYGAVSESDIVLPEPTP